MNIKLSDAEYEVMQILWQHGEMKASDVVSIAKQKFGWKQNTVYTFIVRLLGKGAINRIDPNYMCVPMVTKDEVQRNESETLLDKLYGGSVHLFVKSFMDSGKISDDDLIELKKIINDKK